MRLQWTETQRKFPLRPRVNILIAKEDNFMFVQQQAELLLLASIKRVAQIYTRNFCAECACGLFYFPHLSLPNVFGLA